MQHLIKKNLNRSIGFLKPKSFFGLALINARFFICPIEMGRLFFCKKDAGICGRTLWGSNKQAINNAMRRIYEKLRKKIIIKFY